MFINKVCLVNEETIRKPAILGVHVSSVVSLSNLNLTSGEVSNAD